MCQVCWGGDEGGCAESDTVQAVDDAIQDGVDILSYSIGGEPSGFRSTTSAAFMHAARAGIFVSASAGNSGPDASTADNLSECTTAVGWRHSCLSGNGLADTYWPHICVPAQVRGSPRWLPARTTGVCACQTGGFARKSHSLRSASQSGQSHAKPASPLVCVCVCLLCARRAFRITLTLGDGTTFVGAGSQKTALGPLPLAYAKNLTAEGADAAAAALCAPSSLSAAAAGKIVVSAEGRAASVKGRAGHRVTTHTTQKTKTWLLVCPCRSATVAPTSSTRRWRSWCALARWAWCWSTCRVAAPTFSRRPLPSRTCTWQARIGLRSLPMHRGRRQQPH